MVVQVMPITMIEETIEETKNIQEKMHSISFSDAVKTSIDLANKIINYAARGNRIIVSNGNGKKIEIIIKGLSNG